MKNSLLKYSLVPIENIHCPLCAFNEGELLYSIAAEEAAQHFVLKEISLERNHKLKEHIINLWGQNTCDLIRCNSCGFGFASPYIAGDSTFYSLAYQRTGYPKWKWEYEQTKSLISKIVTNVNKEKIKLLEIGAGNGAFVKNISPEIILKKNILCLEFSDYGQSQIREYGIECYGNDVRTLDSALEENFDLICMFQVLEHMDSLDELFKKLSFLTTNKAHLFIAVPNPNRIYFNELNGMLLDMPPNHIGRWNESNFEKISLNYGWKVVDSIIEPQNIIGTFKQQMAYRYLKVSQNSSSLANLIERIRTEKIRKILRVGLAGLYMLGRLNIFYKAIIRKDLGDSQLVHLIK